MARRFTDTTKWDDPWFRKLPLIYKAFWEFLRDKVDAAGFWKTDFDAAYFFLDQKFDPADALKHFNQDKERVINHGPYWELADFLVFQYGILTEACKPHRPIMALLEKYKSKGYGKGIERVLDTLEEKEQEQEQEKEKKGGAGGRTSRPTLEEVRSLFQEKGCPAEAEKFFDYYESNGWRVGKNPMKNWRSAASNWLRNAQVYDTRGGVQKPVRREPKPNPDCTACGGTGKLPDAKRCWCWS